MAEDPIQLFAPRSKRYPEPTDADVALGAGRAALATIPVIGGTLTEVLSLVLAPAVTRRRDAWFKEVAEALEDAERKIDGFSIENLTQDEAFVSAVIEATRSAISTHKDEKRDALRNGLLNIALHRSTDEDQQATFLRYIDELTVWHIRILVLFQNPPKYLAAKGLGSNYYMGSASQVLEDVYPELKGKRELYDQIAADLNAFLPSIFTTQPQARARMRDFFSSHIRNPNTRRAYMGAVQQFSSFCAEHGILELSQVEPLHVAAFVELQLKTQSKPTVKQRLAALRMLFDWMVVGQVIPSNPAHAVRGPKHTQKRGKTPVLQANEARTLLDSIDITSLPGLRDRALIGLMVYTFARVGAAISMRVEDFYVQGRRGWVRLHEKGGKEHEMPTHHNLDHYLEEYITAAGIGEDRKGPLFRTTRGRSGELTGSPLLQSDVWRMIRKRALAAGIKTEIGCHTFRATGITAYLKNGGRLEVAQQMAAHESSRTTGLYDRRNDEVSLDEVERIGI